ncbi:hypothetical protein HT136_01845 [Novosphingobium profundi]|uniref:hypothetical protein n=1 Tax=Novosphingobium profundi TaxID=1774954 RepID=UPI001BDA7CB8|nr:hypothetical protein [Novosphingobium profundi]MBT0667109.1 hypothetical protein [Novosphingobium profundi]
MPAPQSAAPLRAADLGRRVAIFATIALLDLAAAVALACGVQSLLLRCGLGDADTLMAALIALPLGWTLLASWQLTRTGVRDMALGALAMGFCGGLAWLIL